MPPSKTGKLSSLPRAARFRLTAEPRRRDLFRGAAGGAIGRGGARWISFSLSAVALAALVFSVSHKGSARLVDAH
jgi:hypothetical protein